MLKKTVMFFYALTLVVLAAATIVEHSKGTEWVSGNIYGAAWFSVLWAVLAALAVAYIIKRKMRKPGLVLLHASFIVILAGALTTHVFATKGMLHVRQGDTTSALMLDAGSTGHGAAQLPFTVKLNSFSVQYHSGTSAASDYASAITVVDGTRAVNATVSMNKIFSYRGYRFYQTSFDSDFLGAYLTIYHDPWGIAVTYCGYALLFISLLWLLLDRKGTFRSLLRSPLAQRGFLAAMLCAGAVSGANAASVIPKESAAKIGKLDVLYNERIAPLQTFALDFTEKIYGKRTYCGLSAEQVLTGWIFFGKQWDNEPIIRIKNAQMRKAFSLPTYASVKQLLSGNGKGYVLAKAVEEYYAGNHDNLHKAVADIDDKLQLIMSLRQGMPLKLFPVTASGKITWFSPADSIPATATAQQTAFIKSVFSALNESAQCSDYASFNQNVSAIRNYQSLYGGASLPSVSRIKAELTYNAIPFATILFMFNLFMGIASLLFVIYRLTRRTPLPTKTARAEGIASATLLLLSFAALTWCEALRWIISGNIPLANGYETMLLLAWLVMLLSLIACRRFPIVITFGFLLSGFFLLVSHINQMDPHITPMIPVLSSPLLSVHVSVIMMSYALVSLTFICSVMALVLKAVNLDHTLLDRQLQSLQVLSQIFLYPALTTMGIGIFIGAIWANVSWGQYWTWDPKETWALITFMTYSVPVHTASLPAMRRPVVYHAYLALAFLVLIMTYFGVNYFLEGMHSYA